jgi:hypothetical protein
MNGHDRFWLVLGALYGLAWLLSIAIDWAKAIWRDIRAARSGDGPDGGNDQSSRGTP